METNLTYIEQYLNIVKSADVLLTFQERLFFVFPNLGCKSHLSFLCGLRPRPTGRMRSDPAQAQDAQP